MKSKPKKSKKPPSVKQLMQQAKFKLVIRFVHALGQLLRSTFNDPSADKTGVNRAFAYVMNNAVTGTYPDFILDYSKVMVSEGNLHSALASPAVAAAGGIVKFTWASVLGPNSNANDTCVGVVYCPELNQVVYTANGSTRSSESHELNALLFTGKTVHTWLFFVSENEASISSSMYAGELTVI